MDWKCKLCSVSLDTRAKLFRHYRLHHSYYSRVSPLPCLYSDCICTFQSFKPVKAHLSRSHSDTGKVNVTDRSRSGSAFFTCPLCGRHFLRNHYFLIEVVRWQQGCVLARIQLRYVSRYRGNDTIYCDILRYCRNNDILSFF